MIAMLGPSNLVLKHGGRYNFARGCAYRLMAAVGVFGALRRIDWARVQRLVFVCEGNICRSPFAEAVSRIVHLRSVSCGIKASGSAPANERARAAAKLRGIDMDEHVSTNVGAVAFSQSDLLVGFDPAHLPVIKHLALKAACQYTLLGLWLEAKQPLIPDPFGRDDLCFDHVFGLIDDGVRALAKHADGSLRSQTECRDTV